VVSRAPVPRLPNPAHSPFPKPAVAAVLPLACLSRCHDRPSAGSWLGLLGTAAAGWSLHPLLWSAFALFDLGCWLGAGRRHGVVWNVGFCTCQGTAVALCSSGLYDWLCYWWIRLPPQGNPGAP